MQPGPWSCPQCERRVPSRQDVCHCGFDRRRWPAARRDASAAPEAPRTDRSWRLWGALGAVLLVGILFATLTQPDGRPAATGSSGYPSPPAPEEEPPAVEEPPPAATSPPAGEGFALPPTPARPAGTPSPPPVMDAARRQAIDVLEPLLRPIARQADQLDMTFRSYLESCRPDFRGGPRPGASRYWLLVWTDAAEVGWKDEMMSPQGGPDCRITWIELVEGARSVGTALEAFEEAARANDILPGPVEDLLAAHRLSGWRAHFHRRRGR